MSVKAETTHRVNYPYMPAKGAIRYAPENDKFIQAAKEQARLHSLDKNMPTGAVIVQDGKIIGRGANGSNYHEKFGCERVRLGVPTGQQYELCEGCSPKNHSEPKAMADARKKKQKTDGAKMYLWGHWWACEPCWKSMLDGSISELVLMENSQVLFNKEAKDNIVGRQLD